jgi:predicted RNA binding protein YcfA (HicA-like mRNA interferase family)
MRKLGKIKINIKEPTPTAAERLNQSQQAIRKAKGLPDPSHYKQMAAQKKAEIDSMKEEKQMELKPRNFVAKNAKTVGAGKHKDVKKAIKDVRGQKHKGKMEEEVEQLDELSKSTLGNYTRAAALDLTKRSFSVGQKSGKSNWSDNPEHRKYDMTKDQDQKKTVKRVSGITKASIRLAKEEVEQLDEMPESSMKTRDVHAHLKSKGWAVARTSGGHDIYKHPKAKNIIAVPRHKQLKAPLIKGILKSSQVSEEVVDEAIRIGGIGSGKSSRRSYGTSHGMGSAEGDTLENIPFNAKTEKDKRIKAALSDFGDKMKEKYPKLKEALGDPITIVKKGTNIKQKISPNSYATFKQHGFRKEEKDEREYGYEGDMAISQLKTIARHAEHLMGMMKPDTDLPEWVQSKITLATDYLQTAHDYLASEMNEEVMNEDKSDYQRKIEKNNKRFVAATKRQQNPLSNVPIAKEIEKRMQQKSVKESAAEPTEGEMKGKQQGISRRAQIVKSAAKGKKSDSSDAFQKDPELSSEIHKT